MGYYFNLVFDMASVPVWETAVQRLCAAGAKVMLWEEYDPEFLEMYPERCERLVQLDAPNLPFIVVDKRAENGHWASIRLSWGTGAGFVSAVEDVLTFAERAECHVYDTQQDKYVTGSNLNGLAKKFSKAAEQITDLLGRN